MQDKLEALKENLENHIVQLKGNLTRVQEEQEALEQKISYTEGRVFELQEIIDFMNQQQQVEVPDASVSERDDS